MIQNPFPSTLYTSSGQKEFYGAMREVWEQVEGKGFWIIHKSYIVNTAFVSVYHYDLKYPQHCKEGCHNFLGNPALSNADRKTAHTGSGNGALRLFFLRRLLTAASI